MTNFKYKVGDVIAWTVPTTGHEHKGTVRAIIPANTHIHDVWPADLARSANFGFYGNSSIDRYMVVVPRVGAKGKVLKPKIMAPMASYIDKHAVKR